ncbi:MAG: zf-HC2 domain-containing protein [Lachnospiraceae bacterium]|nr:zf-HC2 domain-containing protein [Lachnospiraceae bacterium]
MEQRLVCETVRDLLPLYIDEITSEQSKQSIEEHLEGCEACKEVLAQMRQPIAVETAPEVKDFKKFMRLPKLTIFGWIAGVGALIALLVCFIVNLAVDRELNWFFIVFAGIITAYAPLKVWIYDTKTKHRFEKGLLVLNICVFALLTVIQLVMARADGMQNIWLWKIGFPITILWSAIVWISVVANRVLHLNWALAIGILCALAVPGNYITNVFAGVWEWADWQEYLVDDFVSNGLGNTIAAVIFLVIGVIVQKRRKKK